MEYKFLKKYLDNKSINITKLSSELNVSRQTIYGWNEKGVIPNKYEDALYKIIDTLDSSCGIDCKIEFEISYNGLNNSLFILDSDCPVALNDDNFIVVIIDEYGVRKQVSIKKGNYSLKLINSNNRFNEFNLLKLNIVRYETDIDYDSKKIKYILYCSTNKKRKQFMSSLVKYKFLMMKNRLEINIDENTNFKDVINYIKLNELDMVLLVSSDEMKTIYRELSYNKDRNDSPMGMYLKYYDRNYTFLCDVLGNKFKQDIEYLNNYYVYLNIIFICMDNIKSCIESLRINHSSILNDLSLTVRDDSLLICVDELFNKVFAHECGHLIFSYDDSQIFDRVFEERRANYFVSFIFDGKYDYFNLYLTSLQSWMYKDPLVKPDIEYIYNLLFKKVSSNVSLNELFDNYNKEVDKLYEK